MDGNGRFWLSIFIIGLGWLMFDGGYKNRPWVKDGFFGGPGELFDLFGKKNRRYVLMVVGIWEMVFGILMLFHIWDLLF